MATAIFTTGLDSVSTPSPAPWRQFVAKVRADAIELGSAEVAQFIRDNPGEYGSEQEAVHAYRADHAFLCPVLGHWFRFEDGVERASCWVHVDAPLIGDDDLVFNYGPVVDPHQEYETGFLLAAE